MYKPMYKPRSNLSHDYALPFNDNFRGEQVVPRSPHESPDEHVFDGDVAFVHGSLVDVKVASVNRVPRFRHADVLRLLRHLVGQVIRWVG